MFEFAEDDLKSNKRGFLTQSQRDYLKMIGEGGVRVQQWNVKIAIGFMFLGLCIISALYLQNEDTRAALFSNPLNLLVFPLIIVVVGLILVLSLWLARRISDMLKNAELKVAEGKIELDQEYSSKAGFTSYYVYVGREKFGFTEDMSHIFKEGEKYRVYYVKASAYELIMSYEKVEGNSNPFT
jgi:hypothetical protein